MATSAFQPNAFQNNAFQAAASVVSGDYSLGSPSFGTPAVVEALAAPAYSLGSPSFATPPATSIALVIHANSYSLGSPTFGTPTPRQMQYVVAPAYSLAGLDIAIPGPVQQIATIAFAYSLGSPTSGAPTFNQKQYLIAPPYSLASPDFALVPDVGVVTVALYATNYSLGSPLWHYPRLTATVVPDPFPAFYADKIEETEALLSQILAKLMSTVPAQSAGALPLRSAVGAVLASAGTLIVNGDLGTPLQACWNAAVAGGATLDAMDRVRTFIIGNVLAETDMGVKTIQTSLLLTLAAESQIVIGMTFTSSNDVVTMIQRMGAAFEQVRLTMLDFLPVAVYETFGSLSAALMQHLYLTELQLPRVIDYRTAQPMPALKIAYDIYADASRYIEDADENRVIHPAFCPINLTVLSS